MPLLAPTVLPGRAFQRIDRVSRLLFHWRAKDVGLDALTGETATFSRASAGGMVNDRNGLLRLPVHSQPRFEMYDLDGDGIYETPTLLLEAPATQDFVQSDAFDNAVWLNGGGCVVTPNAIASPTGAATADLLNFTTVANTNFLKQTYAVADPENRTFCFSIFLKDGTLTEAADGFMLMMRRGDASEQQQYTVNAGTLKLWRRYAGGWARWYCVKTFGASNVGDNVEVLLRNNALGSYNAAGAMLEEAACPSSYVPSTAAPVQRVADALSWPHLLAPRTLSIYCRWIERGGYAVAQSVPWRLGGVNGPRAMLYTSIGSRLGAYHQNANGGAAVTSQIIPVINPGDRVETVVNLFDDGSVNIRASINEGAEQVGVRSGANAPAAAWSAPTLYLSPATNPYNAAYRDLKLAAAGTLSVDQMRRML